MSHATFDDTDTGPDDEPADNASNEPAPEADIDDDVFLDEEWLATPNGRNRWRTALLGLFVIAVVFFAGVEVQKKLGADDSAAASPFGAGGLPSGLPDGFPAGFPGGGAAPGGTTGGTATDGGDTGGAETSAAPAVIGKVLRIKGDTWVIEDLGGTKRRVSVSQDTTITQETKVSSDAVKAGASVTVSGATDANGQVAATEVTVR